MTTTTISAERAWQVIYGCDAPGCGEPWKWHDPETGLRYCDPCAARGWGHCATRCRDAADLPPQQLYATDTVGEYTPLFDYLNKKHGPVATAEVVHENPPVTLRIGFDGDLPDATEAAMTRFDAAHNAEPSDGDGAT